MTDLVRIHGIAAGGDGVGTLRDGRVVFVPRSAPGDLLELSQLVASRRFARARIARVIEPSADRVTPSCPHYVADDCGGCQLQHLGVPAQREARRHLAGDALRRIGHLSVDDPPLTPSQADWGYRTKITLAARGGRVGFHRLGQPGKIFALRECPIARPELNRVWSIVRVSRNLLPSTLDQLVLRVDRFGGCHLIVRGSRGDAWAGGPELDRVLKDAGVATVVWWQPEGGAARTVAGAKEAYPATVFEQVHPAMGDRVRAYAVEQLGEVRGCRVWDLYAGIGETSRALARLGARVESVEADPQAVRVAEQDAEAASVTRHTGRVEDLLARLQRPDLVILNPPRVGVDAAVTSRLLEPGPSRLVYVSCDPATLARDLARLAEAYAIGSVGCFDLFPQTAHVETVVRLERR